MKPTTKVHESYLKTHPCHEILKDLIPGDFTSSELSPVLRYDPQFRGQLENQGFAVVQIGDQLRYLYAGNGKNTYECPECHQRFVNREEFEEHFGGKLLDPEALRNQTVTYSGNINPPATVGMEPGQDLRTEMSSWDNQELRRSGYTQLMKSRIQAKLATTLEKGIWSVPVQKEEKDQAGEHKVPPDMITNLPLTDRVFFEVWAYADEYGAPASQADIAVELATRGIDEEFQKKLEQAAHFE